MVFEIENYAAMQSAIAEFCRFLQEQNVTPDGVFHSRLVANELVGNVLRHSDGKAVLRGSITDGFVELTIFSTTTFCPPERSRCSEVYAESGRGLFLVDSVCEERTFTEEGGIRVRIRI